MYEKIGAENLQKLVDKFYDLVFSSEIIGPLFKNDKEDIKIKQFEFLTQFLGGPQLYTEKYGHPKMRMRHLPHAISEEAKTEWLRCMKIAVNSLDLSEDMKVQFYNCFPQIAQHMVNC